MKSIYLDYNATTPLSPAVADTMRRGFSLFGNPSSVHWAGRSAREAIATAREQICSFFNCQDSEIIFTSGGTESNWCAIAGGASALKEKGRTLVTSQIEHPSVVSTFKSLEKEGYQVIYLPVDDNGLPRRKAFLQALEQKPTLVSLMWANNETGVILPIEEWSELAHQAGAIVHSDAVQMVGKGDIHLRFIDLLSFSAHKIYGPKGSGGLFIREGTPWNPSVVGGGQERKRRGGTENLIGIMGMGKAFLELQSCYKKEAEHLGKLRERLETQIMESLSEISINGAKTHRISNTTSLSIAGISGQTLLTHLDLLGIAISNGSACSSGSLEPSSVLLAMGLPWELAQGTLRISLGRETTEMEIDVFVEQLTQVVQKMRMV